MGGAHGVDQQRSIYALLLLYFFLVCSKIRLDFLFQQVSGVDNNVYCSFFAADAQAVAAAQAPRLPALVVRRLPDADRRAADQVLEQREERQGRKQTIKQCTFQLTGHQSLGR